MSTPLKVGITGGMGSGKTLICKVFAVLGVPIYNADDRAKWLMSNDPQVKSEILKNFGNESFSPDFSLNREYLSKIVFNDSEKLKTLNSLVHPAVGRDFEDFVKNNKQHKYILKEAALIFESGSYKLLDYTINVIAPEVVRINRVLKRDPQRKESQVRGIMEKQFTDEKRSSLADFEILNDGNHLVIPQVLELHNKFLTL